MIKWIHRIFLFVLIACLSFTLFGCTATKTPENAIDKFIAAYGDKDSETLKEYALGGDVFYNAVEDFVADLAYNEESTDELLDAFSDIQIDVIETREQETTAIVKAKIQFPDVASAVYKDTVKAMAHFDGNYAPLNNGFDELKMKSENVDIHLKKKEEQWLIDLENPENAGFMNDLTCHLIQSARDLFTGTEVLTDKPILIFPEHTIHFLDGSNKISVNVNPKLKEGSLIPYYNQLIDEDIIPGWNQEKNLLALIKQNNLTEVPFKEHTIGGKTFKWPNIKEMTHHEYLRENIGVSEKSYCNIDIQGGTSDKGKMTKPLIYKENNIYGTVGLIVKNAGEDIEEPLRMYIDGLEVGQTRKANDGVELIEDLVISADPRFGSPSEWFSVNDKIATQAGKKGQHLVEIIQADGNHNVVYYQSIPYEVKAY